MNSRSRPVVVNDTAAAGHERSEDLLDARVRRHQALGERHRLRIAEALRLSDLTPSDLTEVTGIGSNHVAFHLKVLEDAEVVRRAASEGDRRRRYVQLVPEAARLLAPAPPLAADDTVFVCTRNSARSQLAAALWSQLTGHEACSAGADPAPEVHRLARQVAEERGLDLAAARPRGYDTLAKNRADLVVSVCDRAHEAGVPIDGTQLHWSIPDPVDGGLAGFRAAFDQVAARVQLLAEASGRAA